jgi:class 3 adenylate cyclase
VGETEPLRVRMGLHTAETEVRDGDYFGSEVNRAARLMSIAHGGQIVVSASTASLVEAGGIDLRDLGEHRLAGLSRPERVWQVCVPGWARRSSARPTASRPAHTNDPNNSAPTLRPF